jgi:predicted metal-dependent peptidase
MKEITTQILEDFGETSAEGKRWEDYETIVCPDGTVIDMVALIDDQYRAMAALNHLAPMFGGFISQLKFIYTFRIKTQATDGLRIFVNPQFTNNLDFTGKCFVMAHEIMHCLLNHMRRGRGHDGYKSNIAADYEVNTTLANIGLFKEATMKNLGAYIDMKYADYGYEKIYDIINVNSGDDMDNSDESKDAKKNQDEQDDSQSQQGSSGSGGQGNSNEQHSDDYKAGWAQAIADYAAGKIQL